MSQPMKQKGYAMVAPRPGDASVIQKVGIELNKPEPRQVLIRHTAIGVNFIDVYFRSGLYPWPDENNLILGSEGAGVVEAVGAEVSGFSVGERVAYTIPNGAYASHRIVNAEHLVKIPDEVSDIDAAAVMLKGLTTYYLLHDSYSVSQGETILFHAAAGGVGTLAGQWLKSKGVTAIGTAGGAKKCELAISSGFASSIDYSSEDFVTRVKELTNDRGVDAVFDSIGKDTIMGSLECLKNFGTLVNFGQSSGMADQFKISDLAKGSFTLCRPVLFHYTANRAWLENASELLFARIADGTLNVNIGAQWSLSEIQSAHKALENRATTGSTVLIP